MLGNNVKMYFWLHIVLAISKGNNVGNSSIPMISSWLKWDFLVNDRNGPPGAKSVSTCSHSHASCGWLTMTPYPPIRWSAGSQFLGALKYITATHLVGHLRELGTPIPNSLGILAVWYLLGDFGSLVPARGFWHRLQPMQNDLLINQYVDIQ